MADDQTTASVGKNPDPEGTHQKQTLTDETSGFVIEGGEGPDYGAALKPEPEPKAEPEKPAAPEPKKADELPDWAAERVARAKRVRDRETERAAEYESKFAEATDLVETLIRKLDPNNFASYEEYQTATKDVHTKAEKLLEAKQANVPAQQQAFTQAVNDLADEVSTADPELWAEATANVEVDGEKRPKHSGITQEMVLALADAADSAGSLRALLALSEDDRAEMARLSPRLQRKAIARLQPLLKAGKPPYGGVQAPSEGSKAPSAPQRDPETGQFRKQSAAPEPINPEAGGSAYEVPLEKASFKDFEARRNAEEQRADRFGW